MAKKTSKKKTGSTKKKPTSKAASGSRTGSTKRAAKKKMAPKVDSLAPAPISTGKDPDAAYIGHSLVNMFNQGRFHEIEEMWWSPKVTSIEGHGVGLAWRGRKAVEAKNAGWLNENSITAASAEGPFVGATGFAVRFQMEIQVKATGEKRQMSEVGVYSVLNGKIIQEEFMYDLSKQG